MNRQINHLLQQFELGLLSKAEREQLLSFVDDNPDFVIDEIVKMMLKEEDQPISSAPVDEKWNTTVDEILSIDKVPTRKVSLFSKLKWVAAAIVVLTFSLTSLFYLNKKKERVYYSDVMPGGNKAILTLADGRKIALNDIKNGDLIKESGISISKTADGQLVYNIEQTTNGNTDDSKLNTITTPNGGEWEIRLPDGSSVWLNAASSLKYPLNISKSKVRLVELTGEAYFEVKKDKEHPFIVKTDKQKLEVLGTHFNINSYADELVTKTTLFEGRVRISAINDPSRFELLAPGEQSILSSKGIDVKTVDVDEAIAWKNGYFMFNNERQETILKKIARWYNVQIEYMDPEAKDVMYYGTVSRFEKISKVLRKFEQTGEVRYDIKDNKVLVYKD
ncbi:DUF4974 domain-containing protein [Pedobacter chinensis]|uniref:DUF4974 domain-containing protein n=1 Tax=Pedobacter chinensis TaxID=2282421 RepID=A0A369PXZ3_9SPHI|nr:FecR family protein [Pedobacter chinensis]RDC54958.1 DUF4974 domain-containing protein [Pedobacter chinensis]